MPSTLPHIFEQPDSYLYYGPPADGSALLPPHRASKAPVREVHTKPNTISIFRTSDLNNYVRPPVPRETGSDEDTQPPRDDFWISGVVIVHFAKRRRVRGLQVRFVAEATLAWPDRPWEECILLERTLKIGFDDDQRGMILEPGPQKFAYSFILPPTLAGFDRSQYGRVHHRVEATLVGQPQQSLFGGLSSGLFGGGGGSSVGGGSASSSRSTSPTSSALRKRSRSRKSSKMEQHQQASPPIHTSPSGINDHETPRVAGGYFSQPMSSRSHSVDQVLTTSPGPSSTHGSAVDLSALSLNDNSDGGRRRDSTSRGHSSSTSVIEEKDVKWFTGTMKASKEVWIVPLPTDNQEPLPLAFRTQSLVPSLGFVPWSLSSDAITVGGYMFFRLGLARPNPAATVWRVRLEIDQVFSLRSPSRPQEGEVDFPPTRMSVFEAGKMPSKVARGQGGVLVVLEDDQQPVTQQDDSSVDSGGPLWRAAAAATSQTDADDFSSPTSSEEFTLERVVRLPDERSLRPSTCVGTITPMRVRHEVVVEILFSVRGEDGMGQPLPPVPGQSTPPPGHLRKAKLTHGVLITSCAATVANLALPTYSESLLAPSSSEPLTDDIADKCACGEPLEGLAQRELERGRADEEGPISWFRLEQDTRSGGGGGGRGGTTPASEAERGRSAKTTSPFARE